MSFHGEEDDDDARLVRITEEDTLEAFDSRLTDANLSLYQQPIDFSDDQNDDEYIVDEGEEQSDEDGDGVPSILSKIEDFRPSEPGFPPPPQPLPRVSVRLAAPAPPIPAPPVPAPPVPAPTRTISKSYEMNPFADDDERLSAVGLPPAPLPPSAKTSSTTSGGIPPPPTASPPLPPPPKSSPPSPPTTKSMPEEDSLAKEVQNLKVHKSKPSPNEEEEAAAAENATTTIKNGVVTITRSTRSRSTVSNVSNTDSRNRSASTVGSIRIQTTKCGYIIPQPLKGMMKKLSASSFGTWHERFFQLERGALVYFEPVHWYLRGQIDLVGLKFVENEVQETNPLIIRLVPAIAEQQGKRPDCVIQPETVELRNKWIKALEEHTAFAEYVNQQMQKELAEQQQQKLLDVQELSQGDNRRNVKSSVTQIVSTAPPPIAHGWLFKKGQIFPTIKKRYFVVNEGVLAYYSQDLSKDLDALINGTDSAEANTQKSPEEQLRKLPKALGKFSVFDYQIYSDHSDGRIELYLVPGGKSKSARKLYIYCENYVDRDKWIAALNEHSVYSPL